MHCMSGIFPDGSGLLVPNWLVHDPLEHACRSDGEAVLPPNPVGTDGLTQCLGDTPARWKRLLMFFFMVSTKISPALLPEERGFFTGALSDLSVESH